MSRDLDTLLQDPIIDSRDLHNRYEELLHDLDNLDPEAEETQWAEELAAEIAAFEPFIKDVPDDVQLISEDHINDYVLESVSDQDDGPAGLASWVVIDWDATAANLRMDYTEIEIDDATYYYLG